MSMLSCVERLMKGLSKILNIKARLTIVLDCFNCWELTLLDPIHEIPWTFLPV